MLEGAPEHHLVKANDPGNGRIRTIAFHRWILTFSFGLGTSDWWDRMEIQGPSDIRTM
jgi:hypothetical protein